MFNVKKLKFGCNLVAEDALDMASWSRWWSTPITGNQAWNGRPMTQWRDGERKDGMIDSRTTSWRPNPSGPRGHFYVNPILDSGGDGTLGRHPSCMAFS